MPAAAEADLLALRPFLIRYAMKLSRNREDAEDLAQEAIERALRWKTKLRGPDPDELRKLLVCIVYRQWRKSSARTASLPLLTTLDGEDWCGSEQAPQYHSARLREVLTGIALLPAIHQEALSSDALGYSHGEAALRHGAPAGTTKSRLSRAREAIAWMR